MLVGVVQLLLHLYHAGMQILFVDVVHLACALTFVLGERDRSARLPLMFNWVEFSLFRTIFEVES